MWAPPSRVTFSMGPKGCHHPESLRWIDDATAGWAHQEPNGIRYKFSSHAYSKTFISVQSVRRINIYIYMGLFGTASSVNSCGFHLVNHV